MFSVSTIHQFTIFDKIYLVIFLFPGRIQYVKLFLFRYKIVLQRSSLTAEILENL